MRTAGWSGVPPPSISKDWWAMWPALPDIRKPPVGDGFGNAYARRQAGVFKLFVLKVFLHHTSRSARLVIKTSAGSLSHDADHPSACHRNQA
jgi:hypothetical protein